MMNATVNAFRLAQWLSNRLPDSQRFAIAERLADWRCATSAATRDIIESNLTLVLGNTWTRRHDVIKEVFRNFGRYLVEFLAIDRIHNPTVTIDGYDHWLEARRRAGAVIALTAHLGNWEVCGIVLRRMGLPITAVALPHQDRSMNRLFDQQRRRAGIDVVPLGISAARACLRSLRRGHIVGLLGDRVVDGHGIAVSFCGRRVVLPRGPAVLSQRAQVPIVPTFLTREGLWTFRLTFGRPLWPIAGPDTEGAVRTLTEDFANDLADQIRRTPSQWLMFNRMPVLS